MVFFYFVTTGWIFDRLYVRIQSNNQQCPFLARPFNITKKTFGDVRKDLEDAKNKFGKVWKKKQGLPRVHGTGISLLIKILYNSMVRELCLPLLV